MILEKEEEEEEEEEELLFVHNLSCWRKGLGLSTRLSNRLALESFQKKTDKKKLKPVKKDERDKKRMDDFDIDLETLFIRQTLSLSLFLSFFFFLFLKKDGS